MEEIIKSDIKEPILICTWEGWPDAAEAATKSIKELLSQSEVNKTIVFSANPRLLRVSSKRPKASSNRLTIP